MHKARGFTLIELMVVVAIVAIIASIAIPSYTEQVRKSRRSEAARFVGEMQLELERWRAENPSYANCTGTPCGSGTYPTVPDAAASPFYDIEIPTATATATDYIITAAPRGGTAQAGDRCGTLTLTRSVNSGKPTWGGDASCN
ncbi:type IV pilin protein [Lysobacter sp. D1-1-M9]|uniref:type IV pilin protein n=1 Tax=Novilysobacter longmucuonensis TaxID=3098603 RepID=UPI002FCC8F45